jgi:hypothetical protein
MMTTPITASISSSITMAMNTSNDMMALIDTPVANTVIHPYSILFHGNCIDGWFSAYIAHARLRESHTIEMYPIATGQPETFPPIEKIVNTHVLLLDVSVEQAIRDSWEDQGVLSINCIDHHHSSISHWNSAQCPIDISCCTAIQVHRFFFPFEEVPAWLYAIDRIDRWVNVTYEDRCIREILNIIAHKPVQRKMEEAFTMTGQFLSQPDLSNVISNGKEILDKKDAILMNVLGSGIMCKCSHVNMVVWNLPASWVDMNIFIIDTTRTVIDSSEAAHLVFTNHPYIQIFVNYRVKKYTDATGKKKTVYIYSLRSTGFNLIAGGLFKGQPTAAGLTLENTGANTVPFTYKSG